MKNYDWSQYTDAILCIYCSVDVIVPSWAFMLIATHASPVAKEIFYGTPDQWRTSRLMEAIRQLDIQLYRNERVIIKGCSEEFAIGPEVYVALTTKLVPVVQSLMFGEPCSTVPVFKRPKANG